jgi:hypothetical protein
MAELTPFTIQTILSALEFNQINRNKRLAGYTAGQELKDFTLFHLAPKAYIYDFVKQITFSYMLP